MQGWGVRDLGAPGACWDGGEGFIHPEGSL